MGQCNMCGMCCKALSLSYGKQHFIDNKCTIHDTRPDTCSGFPWYGRLGGSKDVLFSEDCGYMDETDEVRGVNNVGTAEDCKKGNEGCEGDTIKKDSEPVDTEVSLEECVTDHIPPNPMVAGTEINTGIQQETSGVAQGAYEDTTTRL